MRATRRYDTSPELALRWELHRRGLRYRVEMPLLDRRRRVDIVFTRARVAVFVDGCFWHSCPVHGTAPAANAAWWHEKLSGNVERDRRADSDLRTAGYEVVRVWEHEDPAEAAAKIAALVRDRRAKGAAKMAQRSA